MNRYHKAQFICFFLILCLGASLMVYPSLGLNNINYLYCLIMLFTGFIYYTLYILIRRENDYEYLYIALISVISGTIGMFVKNNSHLVLSLSLVLFMSLTAIVKLIKIDYYHDRNNILWFIRTISFVIFLIIGTLTCINLFYNIKIQSLMLGFFLIAVSILEMFDPIADFLVTSQIKKKSKNIKPIIIKENIEFPKNVEKGSSTKKGETASKKKAPNKSNSKKKGTKTKKAIKNN